MNFSRVSAGIKFSLLALSVFVYQKSMAADTDKSTDTIKAVNTNTFITSTKQLTFSGKKSGEGYFSADGKKMIFQSDRDEKNPFYQMYIMDLASGDVKRISTGEGKTTCGWLNPDMKTTMWSSTHLDPHFHDKVKEELDNQKKAVKAKYSWSFDENFDIFSSDVNGKNIKRLTTEKGYDAEGSYSPDGKYIAFASNRNAYDPKYFDKLTPEEKKIFTQDTSYFMDIYIMKADGTEVKQLTTSPGYDGGPFFSADGKKITWRKFNPEGTKAEIYTMNTDGTDQKAVTHMGVMSWAPFFHPSGQYIIFTTSIQGYDNFELYIVDSEGKKEPVRVTFEKDFDGLPTFSPNGQQISWTHRNEKGESQIYLANWDHHAALVALGLKPKAELSLASLKPEIQVSDVRTVINYLASDEMKGRLTGSAEEKVYTNKILELFKFWGLKAELQKFSFTSGASLESDNTATYKSNSDVALKLNTDYQVHSFSASGVFKAKPVVFAGFGISAPSSNNFKGYNSYKGLDVKDKWVVIFDGLPLPEVRDMKEHTALVPFAGLQHKITVAKNNGAAGVIVVAGPTEKLDFKFSGSFDQATLPVLRLSEKAFKDLLVKANTPNSKFEQILKDYNSYSEKEGFVFNSTYLEATIHLKNQKSDAYNVVGILNPGTKPAPKVIKNALLIGAHGDHLGDGTSSNTSLATNEDKGKIHYGADDNASGVSGVLELAHYYSQNRKTLKKPMVFAVWSGEEIGILGSSHFAKTAKTILGQDLNKAIFASVNMDMIGRLKPDTKELFVQGVGSSHGWTELSEKLAVRGNKDSIKISLSSDPYLPTDAMAFYLAGVPSISFFTGAHSEYHTPKDTPETLNYEGLVGVINIVKNYVDELQTLNTLKYEKVEGHGTSQENRSFRLFLGTIPDYTQEGVKGVKISGVSKDSPAEKSGLKSGDIIVEFDKIPISNIYDYVYTLQTVKPNIETKIKVVRDKKTVEMNITPGLKQ